VTNLCVKPKPPGQHGNAKAQCWRYFGNLFDGDGVLVDESRVYCMLCLQMQQSMGNKGHLSKVISFAALTSSGNLNLHLSQKHDVIINSEEKCKKIIGYFQKYKDGSGATSTHEVNRDIALWLCRDLTPFEAVSKDGLRDFFKKNVPSITLPTPDALLSTALEDVYQAVRSGVKAKLANVNALCVMFDGWTDRYKARSYLGVRASFLQDWSFNVVTLGCHVLPDHKSQTVADHVNFLLKSFVPDPKKLYLTSVHDGAANMLKTSKLLKVATYQHCAAHSLHLLLTTDSMSQVTEAVELLLKCRNIVTALHFKTAVMEDEMASTEDKTVIQNTQYRMSETNSVLELDDQFAMQLPDECDGESTVQQTGQHIHKSLKAACPTRWNSTLEMVQSIVDLEREVQSALKRIGRLDLCLHAHELDFLKELATFLKPFKDMSDLFSCSLPMLSTIPLIKMRIRKNCTVSGTDDEKMKLLKEKVLAKLDHRFPITDTIKLNVILDPSTKDLVPREDATTILDNAVKAAVQRGLITNAVATGQSTVSADASAMTSTSVEVDEVDEGDLRRKRMRLQMVNELRSEMNSGQVTDGAVCKQCY